MIPSLETSEKKRRPILYGVLAVGAFAAIVITGWIVLSPSALLHRQLAAASSSPVLQPAPALPIERPVRGRVLDAETGAPLPGASVWAGKEELRTDEDGRFTTPPLGPGAAFLVKSPGYELRRLVAEPPRSVLVTTKEGAFARRILDRWGVRLADVQGKETGVHKCLNLRALIAAWQAERGSRPRLAFVEDRLETLQHVTTHPDLDDVRLFLAAWGYNTEAARAAARADPRIRLLTLEQFRQGSAVWP